ncbi:MAG: hypothetical protein LBP63_03765 [Prevotellaceae bacterium]|jgi:hypothetical protein|nr:hypothetical protein [Prevotellaceae bacterium]
MKKFALITVILAFAANTFAASASIACGGYISNTTNRYLLSGKELQTTGAAARALTAAFPGAAPFIAGGLGALNSILQQGFTNGWNNIQWGQVAFDGVMSDITSHVGGQFGKYMENTKLGNLETG